MNVYISYTPGGEGRAAAAPGPASSQGAQTKDTNNNKP